MKTLWLGIAALLANAHAVHGEEPMRINFDSGEIGKAPVGFTTAVTGGGGSAEWIVRQEADAPSGKKALVQITADPTKYRFPLCVYDAITATDVSVSVRFKTISGTVDQAAGIVWRYQGPDNYYIARANALENNVVLYKMENGKRTDLKPVNAGWFAYGKDVSVTAGTWNELRVVAAGRRFSVSLNGVHLFDVEDDTFRDPGKVGLWTKADSVTAFDDLVIDESNAGE